jgi:hypothetical protein
MKGCHEHMDCHDGWTRLQHVSDEFPLTAAVQARRKVYISRGAASRTRRNGVGAKDTITKQRGLARDDDTMTQGEVVVNRMNYNTYSSEHGQ